MSEVVHTSFSSKFAPRTAKEGSVVPFSFLSRFFKTPAPRPFLNNAEKSSLAALITYVAFNRDWAEDDVRAMLCKRFGLAELEGISPSLYDEASRFLVDLSFEEIWTHNVLAKTGT